MAKIPKRRAGGQRRRRPRFQDARAVRQAAAPLAAGDRERRARRHAHARGRVAQERGGRVRRRSAHRRRNWRSALRKTSGGRYAAKPSDMLFRVAGTCRSTAAGSRSASAARAPHRSSQSARSRSAQFLATGDDTKLRALQQDQDSRRVRPRDAVPHRSGRARAPGRPRSAFL